MATLPGLPPCTCTWTKAACPPFERGLVELYRCRYCRTVYQRRNQLVDMALEDLTLSDPPHTTVPYDTERPVYVELVTNPWHLLCGFLPRFSDPRKLFLFEAFLGIANRFVPSEDDPRQHQSIYHVDSYIRRCLERYPHNVRGSMEPIITVDAYPLTSNQPGLTEWFVNFADSDLFYAYGSSLFAQDEIMTTEYPLLGSVREFIQHIQQTTPGTRLSTRTIEGLRPTPILITNVPRAWEINTANIYGQAFARASVNRVFAQSIPLQGQRGNIIAMSALPCNHPRGTPYSIEEIEYHLQAAEVAFSHAVAMSPDRCVVHTGNWGCGAFGGNKQLMSIVQFIAGFNAGVAQIRYHAFDEASRALVQDAWELLKEEELKTAQDILRMVPEWGVGDGN